MAASLPRALHARVFADAVASTEPIAAGLEDLFANEAAWAVACGQPAFRGCAASAGAVDATLDFTRWDASGVSQWAIVFLQVVRVTHQSSNETDARFALDRLRCEIGDLGQEPARRYHFRHARIAYAGRGTTAYAPVASDASTTAAATRTTTPTVARGLTAPNQRHHAQRADG